MNDMADPDLTPACRGAAVCCRLDAPPAAATLRCRFACGSEVPASVCGSTVCCRPPPQVDTEDLSAACYAVLDECDAVVFAAPTWHGSGAPGKDVTKGQARRDGWALRRDAVTREFSALKPFAIISLAYLLFTTTDGAVRMIVLLHAYNLGFSAWQVAIMFSLYELAGVVTNLAAGLMGARWGIKTTLLTGLTLQLGGIGMLLAWQPSWAANGEQGSAIVFVTAAQMLCGIAKDLTKLGGKTVTKLVTPDEKQSRLFKVVSLITGWKNSMKGIGYFLGAACLTFNYYFALAVLMLFIGAAMPWAIVGLSNQLGRARKENVSFRAIMKQRYNVNVLSAARLFLFGSRDMWFEVPLPFFLRDATYGLGWQRVAVGAMLASFIIMYGQVQSWTPQLVLQPLRQSPPNKHVEALWNGLLACAPAALAGVLLGSPVFYSHWLPAMTGTMVAGLVLYCVLFAVNSSVHSYLIVRYAEGDKVAMNVGFYYMANALGRLTGTLASGAIYTFARDPVTGLGWCFVASVAFAVVSTAITLLLRDNIGGLRCGACLTLIRPPADTALPAPVAAAGGSGAAAPLAAPPAVPPPRPLAEAREASLGAVVEQLLAPELDVTAPPALTALRSSVVLYRADLNVPLSSASVAAGDAPGSLVVADDSRLAPVLPTVQLLAQAGARVVLCSHLGRPQPGVQSPEEMRSKYSLAPVAAVLERALGPGTFVGLLPDCVGATVQAAVAALQPGQVALLENLRFHRGEAANDAAFAAQLAALAGAYINDAFGAVHRNNASITGVLPHFAGAAYPGPLLRRELAYLHTTCSSPQRPLGIVIGGAKVADKLPVLRALMQTADVVIIGGRMAFTFLAAAGVSVGRTQVEHDWLEACREMVAAARARGVNVLLPCDAVVARSLDSDCGCCTVPLTPGCCTQEAPCVPEGCFGLDIGPNTAAAFATAIANCGTIFWNGPMGRFEVRGFAAGTEAVARALGAATDAGAVSVIGGGDSVSAVRRLRPLPHVSFMSTGGGASLELVEGKLLPGLAALAAAAPAPAPAV